MRAGKRHQLAAPAPVATVDLYREFFSARLVESAQRWAEIMAAVAPTTQPVPAATPELTAEEYAEFHALGDDAHTDTTMDLRIGLAGPSGQILKPRATILGPQRGTYNAVL